jgi:non-ribosomal peptide synthetase component E (peptide arylation enzyme)
MITKVKSTETSKFYGVRLDVRIKKGVTHEWYRGEIMVRGKRYYLGAYTIEEHAAYAFNVAFGIFTNEHYKIENIVNITDEDKIIINIRVKDLLKNKIPNDNN